MKAVKTGRNIRLFCLGLLGFTGCTSSGHKALDTLSSGTIQISVDNSYQPLMDSEIRVFETLHPDAHIIAHYKPEADCFNDLVNDSARLIIVTRGLDTAEEKYFRAIKEPIITKILAWDAVALIVSPDNPDTDMTMDQVRSVMDGSSGQPGLKLVFDRRNSSLVRYAIDSINRGKPLPPGVITAGNCSNVVNYVAGHKNALGVIGVSWISDPYDSTGLSFLSKTRVVGIKASAKVEYFKPYQAYIALRSYPLTRAFYFVLREPYMGLGTGFANFLGSDKGQLIIGDFRLFPAKLNIVWKNATLQ
ncbi:MAG TPA: substrate-binding domain-containing protein [Chitinophagaceae bacterium]|nr:substrate-binding domain-containing protein [Chitinophagaceae bacterium]